MQVAAADVGVDGPPETARVEQTPVQKTHLLNSNRRTARQLQGKGLTKHINTFTAECRD